MTSLTMIEQRLRNLEQLVSGQKPALEEVLRQLRLISGSSPPIPAPTSDSVGQGMAGQPEGTDQSHGQYPVEFAVGQNLPTPEPWHTSWTYKLSWEQMAQLLTTLRPTDLEALAEMPGKAPPGAKAPRS